MASWHKPSASHSPVAKLEEGVQPHWNHATRLPNELLVRIFLELQNVTHGRRGRIVYSGASKRGWLGLMLVCRHWRDVLVSTPAFWRKIYMRLDGRDRWTQRCLELSASTSLDVSAHSYLSREFSLSILYPQAYRVRSFDFSSMYCPELLTALPHLFSKGMPQLEDLHFAAHRLVTTTEDIDLQLTSQRFPRLRALSLSGTVSSQDISLYSKLRTLSLSDCSHNLSFDRFLDALAASTQLEELALMAALQLFTDNWLRNDAVPRRMPISLPRLRKLRLEAHGILRTSRFLAHLHLQPSVSLWIEGGFEEPDYVDHSLDTVNTITAVLPPDPSATLPALDAATTVSMEVWANDYEIYCGTPQTASKKDIPNAMLKLTTYAPGGRGWDHFMTQGLDDLVNSFGRSPLTRLNVNGHHRHGTADAWARVFQTFSVLEILHVSGWQPGVSMKTVFLGLHAASTLPAQAGPTIACPRLRIVNVEGGQATLETYEAMLDCCRYRAEKEVMLEALNLAFGTRADDAPSHVRRAYIKDLREVVNYVSRWVRSGDDFVLVSEAEHSDSESDGSDWGSEESERIW